MIRSPGTFEVTVPQRRPAEAGHHDIQYDNVRNGLIAQSQSFFPIGGAEHAIAKAFDMVGLTKSSV